MMTVIVTAPFISVSIHCCCSATLKERTALGSFKPLDNMPTNSLARLHRGGGGGGGGGRSEGVVCGHALVFAQALAVTSYLQVHHSH